MAPDAAAAPRKMVGLPVMVASPVDVGRLLRELEAIDNALLQLGLRAGGEAVQMPRTSHLMEQTIQLNRLNLLQQADRESLRLFLEAIRRESPLLHMSLSADPPPAFIEKLMVWLRREIHPVVLLTVGIQPTIGAGCIVRSTNKYFDFSLRQDFAKKRDMLREALSMPMQTAAATTDTAPVAATIPPAAVPPSPAPAPPAPMASTAPVAEVVA